MPAGVPHQMPLKKIERAQAQGRHATNLQVGACQFLQQRSHRCGLPRLELERTVISDHLNRSEMCTIGTGHGAMQDRTAGSQDHQGLAQAPERKAKFRAAAVRKAELQDDQG